MTEEKRIGYSIWETVGFTIANMDLKPAESLDEAKALVATGEYAFVMDGGVLRLSPVIGHVTDEGF